MAIIWIAYDSWGPIEEGQFPETQFATLTITHVDRSSGKTLVTAVLKNNIGETLRYNHPGQELHLNKLVNGEWPQQA